MYRNWDNQRKALTDAINKGECITCHVCTGTNYPIFFRNFHSDLLLKKSIVPVYVDLHFLIEVSPKSFYSLLLSSLRRTLIEKKINTRLDGDEVTVAEVISTFEKLVGDCVQRNHTVAFFFEDFNPVSVESGPFLKYLEELKNKFVKCSFVYMSKVNINHPKHLSVLHATAHIFENVLYFPIKEEAYLKSTEKGISPKIFKIIYSLTGGIDSFFSVAVDLKNNLSPRERKNIEKYLGGNLHLKKEVGKLWDSLSDTEVELLAEVIWGRTKIGKHLEPDLSHLLKLGLVQRTKNGLRLAVKLLKNVGMEKFKRENAKVDFSAGGILIDGRKVSVRLSESERKILRQLLTNKNKIVGKMAIAKSIWNGSHGRKFDERVVNETVKKLAGKLSESWIDTSNLLAVEDRGYIFRERS